MPVISIDPEVLHAIHLTIFGRIQLLLHPLEVGLLRLLANLLLICVTNWLAQFLTEQVVALDVCLDHIKLVQTLILIEISVLATGCGITSTWLVALVPDEVGLLLLVILQGNLLPQTLDGHENNAMLARLLEQLLRLVLISDPELGLLRFDHLKLLLFLGD